MPQPILQTAGESFRRRLHYDRAAIGIMGTWNPDASLANLKDNDFTDIYNLRMQTIGGYELRSGYTKYESANLPTLEILCKAEYRHKIGNIDTLFDVAIFQDGTNVKISVINRAAIPVSVNWSSQYQCKTLQSVAHVDLIVTNAAPDISDPFNVPAIVGAYQYGTYLIVTVFGIGTFAIYPEGTPNGSPNSALADTWILLSLGKNLANTPWQIKFADSTTGDMFLVQFTETQSLIAGGNASEFWTPIPTTNLTPTPAEKLLPPFAYDRIPLGMKYWRSDYSDATPRNFTNTEHKFFVWSPGDPQGAILPAGGALPVRSTDHLQTKGWGYRFIFVRSFTDAKGNKIKFRSNASTDVWVKDTMYCPPQIYDSAAVVPLQKKLVIGTTNSNVAPPAPGAGQDSWVFDKYNEFGIKAYPSAGDMSDLATTAIKYFGKSYALAPTTYTQAANSLGMNELRWRYALWWMGFRKIPDGHTQELLYYNGGANVGINDPWFTEVPASVLKGAPLVHFSWTDFSTTDGNVSHPMPGFTSDTVEIEVYRTSWSDGDAKLTDGSPAFEPHLYGYVGSIKPGKDFTDDVNDLDIDFSLTPDNYDGFLTGQFSGQVIREYNNKLAIGNCSTSYQLFNPTNLAQLFVAGYAGTPDASYSDLVTNAADGSPINQYGIQYIDSEGNASGVVWLTCDPICATDAPFYRDAFVVQPTGYDPSITGINIWFSIYFGGARYYVLAKTMAPTDQYAKLHYVDFVGGPYVSLTSKTTKTVIENGEIIWSNTNEMFDWPPLNARVVSKTASITALESVVGELMVFSDTRIDYDNISIANPRGEEITKWVGSIGRWTYCKVDKVVFFLSANGLFFGEPGGVVPFPANVQTVVLKYIREEIAGVADMRNAKRATLGYNGKRYELLLHFPTSGDIGGSLPEITIVYKFFNPDITIASIANFVNYRFDLRNDADAAGASTLAINKPIFQTASDGKLFVSYKENGGNFKIATFDYDTQAAWANPWAIEHAYGMGELNIMKIGREVQVTGDFNCNLSVQTSNPNPLGVGSGGGVPSPYSYINPVVLPHSITIPPGGNNVMCKHRIGGTAAGTASVVETTAYAPVVRVGGNNQPPVAGVYNANLKAIDLLYWTLHNHPS